MPDSIITDSAEASETQACSWSAAEAIQLTRTAARLGLPADMIEQLHQRGITIDSARAALLDAAADRDAAIQTRSQRIEAGTDHTDPERIRTRMVDALAHRLNPGAHPLPEAAREFMPMRLTDMLGRLQEGRGLSTRGLAPDQLLARDIGGSVTTSDLPFLLAATTGKELDRQLAAVTNPLKTLSRPRTASDFRQLFINRVGNASGLEKVLEGGEFKTGHWNEERESFGLATYGKIWSVSRQVIINDDLAFFQDLAEEAATAVAELEASLFVQLLVGANGLGAVVGDGLTAFHASHHNVGTAGAIGETTLSEGRQLLREQKGVGGLHLLGATPRTLLVPNELETLAQKMVATITPAVADDANVFADQLSVIVEPRLSDAKRWWLFAEGAFFTHATLNNQGPQVVTREGFTVDAFQLRVRHDFGCHIRDFRYAVTNAGQ